MTNIVAKKPENTTVEMVNSMVVKATNFTTIVDAENALKRYTATDNATRYTIGAIFNAVKEKKLVENVAEWAAKYGYKANTVYQLATIAKNFSYEDMEKWGMGKLIEFRTPETLKLLEGKGVSPENTAKEIREKVEEEKETKQARGTTKPRKVSEKSKLKKEISNIDKLHKAMGDGEKDAYKKLFPSLSEEEISLMDKVFIMLAEKEMELTTKLTKLVEEENSKATAKAKAKK